MSPMAYVMDMCKSLRKVSFKLGAYEFHPDATPEEEREMLEFCKERNGYFHRWVDDVDNSKGIPYVKTMALVEETDKGEMHLVETYNMTFKDRQL